MQHSCDTKGIDVREWVSEISWWKGGASRDDVLSADEIVQTISSLRSSRASRWQGYIDSAPRITHTRVGRVESTHADPIVHACCACSHIVAPEYNATLSWRLGAWEPIRYGKLVRSCNRLVRRQREREREREKSSEKKRELAARRKSSVEWISLVVLYEPFTWIYRACTPREWRRGGNEGKKRKRRVLRSVRSEIRYSVGRS